MTELSRNVSAEEILGVCSGAIHSQEVFAACLYGPELYEAPSTKQFHIDEDARLNICLIIRDYPPMINNFPKQVNNINVTVLAIDKNVFEKDVTRGSLGEFAAEIVALKYQPCKNQDYLRKMEVQVKKRLVLELLGNVIQDYPDLSSEILIKPEYFLYEVIRRRVKLAPALAHSFCRMLEKKVRKTNVDSVVRGYIYALEELQSESYVKLSDNLVKIDKPFIEATKQKETKLKNILSSIQRALLPYVRSISSKLSASSLLDRTFLPDSLHQKAQRKLLKQLGETERYLLMPTPVGLVPLSDKTSIQDFVRKTVPGGEELEISIEETGGVLNSIFLLRLKRKNRTRKIIVKKFEDWSGFKWFPLALWALGTQTFAVLGKTRLEREYAANQFLRKHNFAVPQILYVSLKERLIFEEFVEGKKLVETVKQVINSAGDHTEGLDKLKSVGKEIAKIHSLGMVLGDCKPENILLENNKVYFLDLEQATKDANKPWDIAEFLYYSGHYALPINSERAKLAASSFLEGYLEGGGRAENVKKAASPKYTKVFSVFTLPHIILVMADVCRKMGRKKETQ